jgi:hypothetical protein
VGHIVFDPARVDVVMLLDGVLEDDPVVVIGHDITIPKEINRIIYYFLGIKL